MVHSKVETSTFCPELAVSLAGMVTGMSLVVSRCSWVHGTCIHKTSSPRVPAASLRLQWGPNSAVMSADDNYSSPGASVSCRSSREWPCQVAGSMLSTPDQRYISSAFFLSHYPNLSIPATKGRRCELGLSITSLLYPSPVWGTGCVPSSSTTEVPSDLHSLWKQRQLLLMEQKDF